MSFEKGHIPWHKGKKLPFKPRPKAIGRTVWNKGIKTGIVTKGATGIIPWNKDKHYSLVHSHSFKQGHTPWNKGLKGFTAGAKNGAWKGGVTKPNKLERAKFRQLLQDKVFYRDNYSCQICDQYGGYLQVDHIKSWADFPNLRFELTNCRTLCMACHYYVTFKRKLPQGVVWGHNFNRRIV